MSQVKEEELWISKGHLKIFGILSIPIDGHTKHPVVVLSHGFGGVHSYNTDYAKAFAQNGFLCYNFDFCGGAPESRSDGSMLDMSVLTEADDLETIIDQLKKRSDVDPEHIFLWGESQGGFVSAYVAARRKQEINGLLLFYPAFVLQDDAKARVWKDGSFPATSSIMGIRVSKKYNEDAVSFDIYQRIGDYSGDVLIIHGMSDPIVPISYSQKAAEIYSSAKLVQLKAQGHGFTGSGRKEATALAVNFLLEHMTDKKTV